MNTPLLFPIIGQRTSGLVRMAEEAEHADEGHNVEFKMLKVRSVLNRSVSKRQLWMAYSINPYRGCEFGCRYCYARYTHEFLAPKEAVAGAVDLREPDAFERTIFAKENAAWLLEQELKKIDPAKEIALGTATDPYQPIERRMRVTRSLLEVFARRSGHRLGIVTKSRLIERDVDLLAEIARRNTLVVHLTITTADAELARKLEPRAPRPDLRFAAVKTLRAAGITTGVLCSPLLPGITDTAEALDGMARRAAEAGANFFAAQPLFLKPCSKPTYLQFVEEHFPALLPGYVARFKDEAFAGKEERERLARMVDVVCTRYGLGRRSSDALLTRDVGRGYPPAPVREEAQGRLFA